MPMLQPFEDAFTAFAEDLPRLFGKWLRFPIEESLDPGKALVGSRAEPTVGADATEAFRKDVLEEATNELDAGKAQKLLLSAAAFGVSDGHELAVICHDCVLADGGATDITREVVDDMFARADRFAVGVPRFAPNAAWDSLVEIGSLRVHGALHEDTHLDREASDREKVIRILGAHPSAVRGEAALRNDVMKVWVVFELARPGVEHAEQPQRSAEILLHGGQFLERLSAALKEELVTEFLVGAEDAPQRGRHGESDEMIGDVGNELGLPFLGPIETGMMPAERAVAVIAGMVGKVICAAVLATVQGPTKRRRAASEDSLGGTTMLVRDALTEACLVGTPVPREDFFEVQAQAVGMVAELGLGLRLNDVLVKSAQDLLSAFLPHRGEMGVDEGLIEGGVTEVGRDMANTHPIFKEMRGITMTQGVRCDPLLEA